MSLIKQMATQASNYLAQTAIGLIIAPIHDAYMRHSLVKG